MGIEKFFNSIKKSYGNKIISKIEKNIFYPDKYFLIDFNSIIHNVSQSISTSIIYLYHILCTSNTYPLIFVQSKTNIDFHIQNLRTFNNFILNSDIGLPDIDSENNKSDVSTYTKTINFQNLMIEDIDDSFFKLFINNDNLDNFIIHKVAEYVETLISYFPSLSYVYLAIDGVPLFAKMIEQKKRRTIGHILSMAKLNILESYKNDLDIEPNQTDQTIEKEIYYNHYKFEKKIINFKFDKNKISPGCAFMTNLQIYVGNFFKSKFTKIKFELDPYSESGEGEKKIVYKIHQLAKSGYTGQITTYSPDADVILLMLLELDKFHIQIMRYDQQLSQLDMINIDELKKIIINYMRFDSFNDQTKHLIIKDIVMLFTLLGNDFLPKLNIINTNKHIRQIFDAYLKLNQNIKTNSNDYMFIFSQIDKSTNTYSHKINWQNLKHFFINLHNQLKSYDNSFSKHKMSKEWTIKPDQIINSNAISYYQHIFNIENLANIYDPSIQHNSLNTDDNSLNPILSNRICLKYLQGFIWLSNYYLDHNFDYKLFHYKYNSAPTIKELIKTIDHIIKDENKYIQNKIMPNLNKTIISESKYFQPITQLIYISPINISDIADKKLLTKSIEKIATKWDLKYNMDIQLNITNNKINLYDYLDCSHAMFISKCELNYLPKLSGRFILKKLT
jgi:5'-3' exonuclease